MKYISEAAIEDFLVNGENIDGHIHNQPFVDVLRQRIDIVKDADSHFKDYAKEEKKRKRRAVKVDSDLSDYL
jgi:hypothetical protein